MTSLRNPATGKDVALVDLLAYDPETGTLTWQPRPREMFASELAWKMWNARFAGGEAFATDGSFGSKRGTLFRRKYLAHRVIWALTHGEWPTSDIDHINGNPSDNRLVNLRDVSHADNGRNQKRSKSNTSGVTGIHWYKSRGKWQASIQVDGRHINLGYFRCPTAATVARKAAEKKYGFHENHGRAA